MRQTWDVDLLYQGFHITYIIYSHSRIIYIHFPIGSSNNSDISASISMIHASSRPNTKFCINSPNVFPVLLHTPTFFFRCSLNMPVTNPYQRHCDWYVISVHYVVIVCAFKVLLLIFPSSLDLVYTRRSNWYLSFFRSRVGFISWIACMASAQLMTLFLQSSRTSTSPIKSISAPFRSVMFFPAPVPINWRFNFFHGSIYKT